MTVIATITQSVDGYIAGPDDGPSAGLGIGGERLHYWVFGGPWSYDDHPDTAGHRRGQGVPGRGDGTRRRQRLRPVDVRGGRALG